MLLLWLHHQEHLLLVFRILTISCYNHFNSIIIPSEYRIIRLLKYPVIIFCFKLKSLNHLRRCLSIISLPFMNRVNNRLCKSVKLFVFHRINNLIQFCSYQFLCTYDQPQNNKTRCNFLCNHIPDRQFQFLVFFCSVFLSKFRSRVSTLLYFRRI